MFKKNNEFRSIFYPSSQCDWQYLGSRCSAGCRPIAGHFYVMCQSRSQSIFERNVPTVSSSSWVLFKALFNHLHVLSITNAICFVSIPKQGPLLWFCSKELTLEQASHNILHLFLYLKCTVDRNGIKCNIAQYKSIALSQDITMHLCLCYKNKFYSDVFRLNKTFELEPILWGDRLLFIYIIYRY